VLHQVLLEEEDPQDQEQCLLVVEFLVVECLEVRHIQTPVV